MRLFAYACAALLLAACDSKPLDWNSLVAVRLHDQVPGAEIKAIDSKTLQASFAGKTTNIDTTELQTLCNRGPKDCDYAFDQLVAALRGPAKEAPK